MRTVVTTTKPTTISAMVFERRRLNNFILPCKWWTIQWPQSSNDSKTFNVTGVGIITEYIHEMDYTHSARLIDSVEPATQSPSPPICLICNWIVFTRKCCHLPVAVLKRIMNLTEFINCTGNSGSTGWSKDFCLDQNGLAWAHRSAVRSVTYSYWLVRKWVVAVGVTWSTFSRVN